MRTDKEQQLKQVLAEEKIEDIAGWLSEAKASDAPRGRNSVAVRKCHKLKSLNGHRFQDSCFVLVPEEESYYSGQSLTNSRRFSLCHSPYGTR